MARPRGGRGGGSGGCRWGGRDRGVAAALPLVQRVRVFRGEAVVVAVVVPEKVGARRRRVAVALALAAWPVVMMVLVMVLVLLVMSRG